MSKRIENEAEDLYADYLDRLDAEPGLEFEAFAAAHPEHVSALRRLHENVQRLDALRDIQELGPLGSSQGLPELGASEEDVWFRENAEATIQQLREHGPAQSPYVPLRPLGRGSFGEVYEARETTTRRRVAIKRMRRRSVEGTGARAGRRLFKFLEEAQTTAQLNHPSIPTVHAIGVEEDGRPFFTMPVLRGHDLSHVFELVREQRDGWNQTRALDVLLKVCEAVAYAHSKGVVHRDLKPDNIRVGAFGEAYVMDWGLASVRGRTDPHDLRFENGEDVLATQEVETDLRSLEERDPDTPLRTRDGTAIGTPAYMSPEQAAGDLEQVDHRTDVYAIGAILYQLLTGQPPYVKPGQKVPGSVLLHLVCMSAPTPILELAPGQPGELVAICEKAMARAPGDRYLSARHLAEDLRAFLENRVVSAYQTGASAELRKWVSRNRGLAITAATLVLVVLGSAIAIAAIQTRANSELGIERDLTYVPFLVAQERELFPVHPDVEPAIDSWIGEVESALERQALHRERGVLEHEFASLSVLLERVRSRKDEIAANQAKLTDATEDWVQFHEWMKNQGVTVYGGLEIPEQDGLVPLGANDAGYYEFWHVASGTRPKETIEIDDITSWDISAEHGVILILVPGGEFQMGLPDDIQAVGALRASAHGETVTLSPFFLSKYELTQAQWMRVSDENPSFFQEDTRLSIEEVYSLRNPAEQMSWKDAKAALERLGLALPTEAQWEFATRSQPPDEEHGYTAWYFGDDPEDWDDLTANILDFTAQDRGGPHWSSYELDIVDGQMGPGPVGRYRASPLGFHDLYGNVCEWCEDMFDRYNEGTYPYSNGDEPRRSTRKVPVPTYRGGAFYNDKEGTQSVYRFPTPGIPIGIGIRPARPVYGLAPR